MLEQAGHQVARAKEPGAHAGLGDAKNRGNLHTGEFLESGQNQYFALLGGQLVNAGENMSMVLDSCGALLCVQSSSGQHACQFGNVICFRARFRPALAVEHNIPNDANQPDPVVANLAQSATVTQNA